MDYVIKDKLQFATYLFVVGMIVLFIGIITHSFTGLVGSLILFILSFAILISALVDYLRKRNNPNAKPISLGRTLLYLSILYVIYLLISVVRFS